MPLKPLSSDTPLEVERIWLAGIREQGPLAQLRKAAELTQFCREAAREAVKRARPGASDVEVDEYLLREWYGEEIARKVIELRIEKGFYDRRN